MKSSLNKTSDVNGTVVIEIEKADYLDKVEKSLNQYRQKASIPGFRQGKMPKSMVQKMYGKAILADEINKLVSEELGKFIHENKLRILGEPIADESDEKMVDLEKDENFTFYFDIALTPEFELTLDKKSKLTNYVVNVGDDLVEKQIDAYKQNLGTHETVETQSIDNDLIKGVLVEMENDKEKEGGLVIENAILMPSYIKDEAIKNSFIGKNVGDSVVFHPKTAYDNNEAEVASLLQTTKDEVKEINSDFRFDIKEITRYKAADLNQELFDKIFPAGTVTNEEEFRAKMAEMLSEQFKPNAEYLFLRDAKELILKKMKDVVFPDEFLKNWLKSQERRTPESVEEDYPKIIEDLKFHLAKEKISEANDFKVEKEDLEGIAAATARQQFAQYGMNNVPDDILQNYVKEMMSKEDHVRGMYDRAIEHKFVEWLKKSVKVTDKEVTSEEFSKLLQEEK
jgi:trigger factor